MRKNSLYIISSLFLLVSYLSMQRQLTFKIAIPQGRSNQKPTPIR